MKFIVEGYPAWAYTGGRPFAPNLPAVILLHGAASDHSVWHYPARYLAHHGFCVLAPDLPAHGRSPGNALASVSALARWTASLITAAGIDRACVAGHSLGSLVALELAVRHPDCVSRLALLGTAAPMPVGEAFLAAAKDDSPAALDMQAAWGHARYRALSSSSIPGLNLVAAGRQLVGRARHGVQYTDLKACHEWAPDLAALRSLAVPTLVIAGRHDQMTPMRAGEALAREVAGARCLVLESGHNLPVEDPQGVAHALRAAFA